MLVPSYPYLIVNEEKGHIRSAYGFLFFLRVL